MDLTDPGAALKDMLLGILGALAGLGVVQAVLSVVLVATIGIGVLAGPNALITLYGSIIRGMVWAMLSITAKITGRTISAGAAGGAGLAAGMFGRTPSVKDPAVSELERRRKVDPMRDPGPITHGKQWTPAGVIPAVSIGVAAESGSAKGQTYVNPYIEHQMRHSREHLLILEAKPNLELSEIVYAHRRPGDVIRELSFQSKDRVSSALDLWRDRSEIADLAHMLTHRGGDADNHWDGKAADLITAAAREMGRPLPQVADVITDRDALADLRAQSRRVDNVADEDREWGYIRSTAARALAPLSDPVLRRVVAGGDPDHPVSRPNYSSTDGRLITIIRPDWRSAERTRGIITAVLHAEIMAAVDGGYAGGPGTKVVLDEAASCVRLSRLGSYMELARGGKINLVYVLQSLQQLQAQLGRDEAARVWAATEAKIIGATSDNNLATEIAKLSGRRNVHYSGPKQHGEIMGGRREHERDTIQAHEITGQQEGEFTLLHRGRIRKYCVPPSRYHYTKATRPRTRPTPACVAHPDAYAPYSPPAQADPDPGRGDQEPDPDGGDDLI